MHALETLAKDPVNPVKCIAVTSGKGGVGKTNIAVNLAWQLAERGERVLLLDADLGLANVDIVLGLRPKWTLADVLADRCGINDILLEGPGGIRVLPAASGVKSMACLGEGEHQGIVNVLSGITADFDTMVVDTAAGIDDSVVSFSRASHHVLVVASREPTSMADAYALIKVLNQDAGLSRFKLLINMAENSLQARESFERINTVCQRFLELPLEYAGMVPRDSYLQNAVACQQLVSIKYPGAPSSRALKKLAAAAGLWGMPDIPDTHDAFFMERMAAAGAAVAGAPA